MQLRFSLTPLLTSIIALSAVNVRAATFTWGNTSGGWSTGAAWQGGASPTGLNPTDILIFGGDVGNTGLPTTYISTNNIAASPFQLNELRFTATDVSPATSGLSHLIGGSVIRFSGSTPAINHNGTANIIVDTPIQLVNGLTIGGTGTGRVTANNAISGYGNITKVGATEFRFGTVGPGAANNPSQNTWMGKLIMQEGSIRFNNNAQAGATALRANPIEFTGNAILSMKRDAGDQGTFESSLRIGTLSGNTGNVITTLEGQNTNNFDIVITALTDGTFGGSITIPGPTGLGDDAGKFILRGPGKQTLTGSVNVFKDTVVGSGATLVLANNATFGFQSQGGITMAGGTIILDNTASNINGPGRLRDGTASSSTLETIGGGTLRMIGNVFGTTELTGRLQLGALNTVGPTPETRPRSGQLNIELVHTAGANGPTELKFQSYVRDTTTATAPQLSTVDFSATSPAGSVVALGGAGNNPRVLFTSAEFLAPPTINGLLSTTTAGNANPSIGWATVKTPSAGGADNTSFASYGANGVVAVATTNWATNLPNSANALITGNAIVPAQNYIVNSIKMAPTAAGQALTLTGTGAPNGHLVSTAFLLAGAIDFAISATGDAGIAGNSPRFFHVPEANLTLNARLNVTQLPVVKSGAGTLILTNPANNGLINDTAILAINGGAVRATPGTSLPAAELRFRGGQLEIVGGGTFTRSLGFGAFTVNWSGVRLVANVPTSVDEDRGNGGFAAIGDDVKIDLNNAGVADVISWEDIGFVRSGYSLTFGSRSATNRVEWSDNLSLSEADPNTSNYNSRDIRVLDNPASTGDWAVISGSISGKKTNDLLKTGPGKLELTGVNIYEGATIINEGSIFVNGDSSTSFLHEVMTGGTLGGIGKVADVRIGSGEGLTGTLSLSNLFFTDSTSKLLLDLAGTGSQAFDQLDVKGSVSLANGDIVLDLAGAYVPNQGDIFFIILNDGSDPVQGTFLDGVLTMDGQQPFTISYTANSATGLMTGGNDVAVQYIPEPSSSLLLGLGSLFLARRRRK